MNTLLPLAEQVATLLKQRRESIAVAESSSGGLDPQITIRKPKSRATRKRAAGDWVTA